MATILSRLKTWSISLPSIGAQPPAIRAVTDLLELLMEATTQLNDALEQFSGEERRNTLQSRIREHEWEMEKRELLKERGALREQLERHKDLHNLAEEKLQRIQAATTTTTTAATKTTITLTAPVLPPTPRRTTSPTWLPTLPPVANVSAIPITLPELSPKSPGIAQSPEIKAPFEAPSRPTGERTEPPVPVASLQPITNLPLSPVSPYEVVSRRRVRPATATAENAVIGGTTTGSAPAPPVSPSVTLVASTGDNMSRARPHLRGPRAQSALVPPRILPMGPTSKTQAGTHPSGATNLTRSHSVAPSTVQSDREAALQTLTSAVTLLSSSQSQRHSVQPASNTRSSGASHPPSSMRTLVSAPPRRESLPTTQRSVSLLNRQPPPQPQNQSQSQAILNHIRTPRTQQPSSPPPSFPEGLARRTALRRSSREIVI